MYLLINTIMILKRLDMIFYLSYFLYSCVSYEVVFRFFIHTKRRYTAASSTWIQKCRSTFKERRWRLNPSQRALKRSTESTAINPKVWYPFLPDTETFQLFLAEEIINEYILCIKPRDSGLLHGVAPWIQLQFMAGFSLLREG